MSSSIQPDVVCIGAVLWDIIARAPTEMHAGADVPGRIKRLPGGVAMNVAVTLRRFGLTPTLLTAIGRDPEGDDLVTACTRLGLHADFVHRSADLPTDCYLAIEDPRGLVGAVADAHSLESAGAAILQPLEDGRLGTAQSPWPGLIVLDGNLTTALLSDIAHSPLFAAADLRVAPASPGKAERLLPLLGHAGVTLYVNLEEAGLLCGLRFENSAEAARALLARGARRVLVTDGGRECCDGRAGEGLLLGQPRQVGVNRVTGAGDTFMAAHLAAERRGLARQAALDTALSAAADYIAGEHCAP
ncbi:MAG: kinase [Opitutus sp.]|nr:kinase [Opitutus sp.]